MDFSVRTSYQVIGLLFLIVIAACGGEAGDASPASSTEEPVATETISDQQHAASEAHEATGTVANILAGRTYVVIDHGPIPGYMGAMKGMVFPVSDTSLLAGIQPGDSITFTFTEADGIQTAEKKE